MTTRTARILLPVLLPLFCLCHIASEARADYYKYTDDTGSVCLTNNRNAVPPKFRSTMTVIRDEARPPKVPDAPKAPNAAAPMAAPATEPVATESAPRKAAPEEVPTGKFGELSSRYIWFKPLMIIGAIFAGFLIVTKVATLLPSQQMARVIYLVYFLGIMLFAYKSYADHMAESFVKVKGKVLTMFKKANERELHSLGPKEPAKSENAD